MRRQPQADGARPYPDLEEGGAGEARLAHPGVGAVQDRPGGEGQDLVHQLGQEVAHAVGALAAALHDRPRTCCLPDL